MIFLALLMVYTPIVIPHFGTFSIPLKALAEYFLVMLFKITKRVELWADSGGSLNPIFPSRLIPNICKSIPP